MYRTFVYSLVGRIILRVDVDGEMEPLTGKTKRKERFCVNLNKVVEWRQRSFELAIFWNLPRKGEEKEKKRR